MWTCFWTSAVGWSGQYTRVGAAVPTEQKKSPPATITNISTTTTGRTTQESSSIISRAKTGSTWHSHSLSCSLTVLQSRPILSVLSSLCVRHLMAPIRRRSVRSCERCTTQRAMCVVSPSCTHSSPGARVALVHDFQVKASFQQAAPRPSVEVAAEAAAAAIALDGVGEVKKKRGRHGEKGAGQRVEEPKGRDSRARADKRNAAKKVKQGAPLPSSSSSSSSSSAPI